MIAAGFADAPCPGFDLGEGRRRWRALDLGTSFAYVEADAPRVSCRRHGVVVCALAWARQRSRFTRGFEDQTAWLAVNTSKSAVAALMRIAWRTVGQVCERVAAEAGREVDLLSGLERIGIDEISHRKGQRYLTVVVDHDTGRLVWAVSGRDRATVLRFFDQLGEERCKQDVVLQSAATLTATRVRQDRGRVLATGGGHEAARPKDASRGFDEHPSSPTIVVACARCNPVNGAA